MQTISSRSFGSDECELVRGLIYIQKTSKRILLFLGWEFEQIDKGEGFSKFFFKDGLEVISSRKQPSRNDFDWMEPSFVAHLPSDEASLVRKLGETNAPTRLKAVGQLLELNVATALPLVWSLAVYDSVVLKSASGDFSQVNMLIRDLLCRDYAQNTIALLIMMKSNHSLIDERLAREMACRCNADIFWGEIVSDSQNQNFMIRKRAAWELGHINRKEVAQHLGRIASDSNGAVKFEAEMALKAWYEKFKFLG